MPIRYSHLPDTTISPVGGEGIARGLVGVVPVGGKARVRVFWEELSEEIPFRVPIRVTN